MEHKENAIVPALEDDAIRSRIFTIRSVQVMLDRDLAELYGVEVKQFNRQVRRNLERFPDDFMFQMNRAECSRCQIGTFVGGRGGNIQYPVGRAVPGEPPSFGVAGLCARKSQAGLRARATSPQRKL